MKTTIRYTPARCRLALLVGLAVTLAACQHTPPAAKTEVAPTAISAPEPVAPLADSAPAPAPVVVQAPAHPDTSKLGEERLNRLLLSTLKTDQKDSYAKPITDSVDLDTAINAEFHDFIHPPAYHGNENAETIKAAIAKGKHRAAAGDPFWLNFMGMSYITGKGVERDAAKGVDLVQKASAAGNDRATCTLARLNEIGLIVPMDKAKAVQLYEQCARKEPGGGPQLRLGQIYEFGFGVERDYQQAMNWYTHAATDPLSGNVRAEFALGRMYAKGIGVSRNYRKAAEWFTRAAGLKTEKGVEKSNEVHRSSEAVCAMAIMYKYGVGMDRNITKAEQLLHLDLANGESWCREI